MLTHNAQKQKLPFQYDTECVHIRETRVQAPHVTFLATYDLNTGSPRGKTTKRNGIRENPKEQRKTRERERYSGTA